MTFRNNARTMSDTYMYILKKLMGFVYETLVYPLVEYPSRNLATVFFFVQQRIQDLFLVFYIYLFFMMRLLYFLMRRAYIYTHINFKRKKTLVTYVLSYVRLYIITIIDSKEFYPLSGLVYFFYHIIYNSGMFRCICANIHLISSIYL